MHRFREVPVNSIRSFGLKLDPSRRLYFIPCQPRRDPEGKYLFRTHAPRANTNYNPFHPDSMLAQVILYQACHSKEFVNGARIDDIHNYLFWKTEVTKRRMGDVIINSVIYNPRVLKAVTKMNDRACMMYVFEDMLDLQYGLEWQMCSWLYKSEEPRPHMERMEELLSALRDMRVEDVKQYVISVGSYSSVINWQEVWDRYKLFDQTDLLVRGEMAGAPPRPEPLIQTRS